MKRSEFLMQAEEQVRKISSDLRREIVDLGGAENIIELRMKKKIRNNTTAPKDPVDVPVVRETHLPFFIIIMWLWMLHIL